MKRKPDEAHAWTDEQLEALESRIAAEYQKAAGELGNKINAYFAQFQERDAAQKELIGSIVSGRAYTAEDYKQWRLAQLGRGEHFEALRDQLAERMTRANDVAAAYINDATPGLYALNRNFAAYDVEQQTGANAGFPLWDEQTVKRLMTEQPDLMPYYPPARAVLRGIDLAWGKRQITAQVTSGILLGESLAQLADRLQTNIPDMNRASALRAARTAVTRAQNAGRLDSYCQAEAMGIRLKKRWLSTMDGRTRHAHQLLDGQTQDCDKPFDSELGPILFPGDPSADPANVYNCRCTMDAEVEGSGRNDALRRDRYGLLPNMTYAEWEASKRDAEAEAILPYHKTEWTKPVEKPVVERYNDVVKGLADVDGKSSFEEAKSGGRHKGVYTDAMKKTQAKLEKSIASHVAQVEEHADKIKHPEKYDIGWAEKDDRQREGLLKKWQKDLQRNAEQAEIEIEVWKERFGNDD